MKTAVARRIAIRSIGLRQYNGIGEMRAAGLSKPGFDRAARTAKLQLRTEARLQANAAGFE